MIRSLINDQMYNELISYTTKNLITIKKPMIFTTRYNEN